MHWTEKLHSALSYQHFLLLCSALTGVILYGFLFSHVTGTSYDVQLFQLSDETIRSVKTVEDPVKTTAEQDRAENEVPPIYQFHEEIAANQAAVISSFLDYVLDAKKNDGTEADSSGAAGNLGELRENLRTLETEQAGLRLTDDMLRSLLNQPAEELEDLKNVLATTVQTTLEEPVRDEDLTEVRNDAEQLIRENGSIPAAVLPAAVMIGRSGIIPNEMVNEELTAAQKQQARASVEPTRILQGQVLVQEGQVIDREVYRQLELAGLTEQQADRRPLIGLALFVLIVLFVMLALFQHSQQEKLEKRSAVMVFIAVLTLSLVLLTLISAIEGKFDVIVAFLFPTALAGMVTRLLTTERLAVFITVVTAACAGIMLQNSYAAILQMDVALYILFGGLAGVYLIQREDRGVRLLRSSLFVSAVNGLFVGFYLLLSQSQHAIMEIAFYGTAALLSGLLSGALTIGLLPFFESVFGLLTTLRLLELSNPNHPLLKKILVETPGTYHHSIMVANLADAACEEIGANGLLARVGSYYHDIGKTERPPFFIENQINMPNPHNSLPPEKSRDIILAHAPEGAKTLEKHKMPQEIVDIAAQHHGTSLLKFFYYKAKEKNSEVCEADYRYAGPKPQTKEIAVISIADSVEAAVRSMKEPSAEKISSLVDAIVEDKLKDGQFDNCDLTMKELKVVKRVMCETMNGIFHSRIEYPKEKN